tara:strand:- start:39112 stop:39501 length:390 start_codon:yes stop_codon:yes gene_type:complete
MILYHGTDNSNLIIKPHGRSRYGFPAFFGSPNAELAMRYARHRSQHNGVAALYKFEVDKPRKVVDWTYRNTYAGGRFRNLIYELYDNGIKSALITNALDYPTVQYREIETNDIVVIYDMSLIKNLERIN